LSQTEQPEINISQQNKLKALWLVRNMDENDPKLSYTAHLLKRSIEDKLTLKQEARLINLWRSRGGLDGK
tara:strand:+ start:616 stop:825 length:210 start_codon:yes stop_codon:yes gene_type:complete